MAIHARSRPLDCKKLLPVYHHPVTVPVTSALYTLREGQEPFTRDKSEMEAEMSAKLDLIKRLRSPDHKVALRAVEGLRAHGWLEDGELGGMDLQHVHLQRADLYKANLQGTDLSMADLRWANLSCANLQGAQLNSADLYRADLSKVELKGANLFNANLQGAHHVAEEQFAQANALLGATMPDGSRYDGRFKLEGDILTAHARGVDTDDLLAMIDFYAGYDFCPQPHSSMKTSGLSICTDAHIIRMLRSPENGRALSAVDELRTRGRLSDGTLEWCHLRFVHLRGANLSKASLQNADLSMADLKGANMVDANLQSARLTGADLEKATLTGANLRGALLARANLTQVHDIDKNQLIQASRLRGARLPNGERYDGRYCLSGDLSDAEILRVDSNDVEAMARFYGVSAADYVRGQLWTREHMPVIWQKVAAKQLHSDAESLLVSLIERESEMAVKA